MTVPIDPHLPALEAVLGDLRGRVDSLERWQQSTPDTTHRVSVTFTTFPSPVWRPPAPLSVTDLWAAVGSAVGADTTFSLRRNGTSIGTVTIANGDKVGMASIGPIALDVYDTVDVVRTAGSVDATVQAIGTSQHPITPSLSGAGGLPLAVCDHGDNYPP